MRRDESVMDPRNRTLNPTADGGYWFFLVAASARKRGVATPAQTGYTPRFRALPLSADETQSAMQMTAGRVAYVLKSLRLTGEPWPSALDVDADNMVLTAEGDRLAPLPAGTTATYTRSTSGENYRLTTTDDATEAGSRDEQLGSAVVFYPSDEDILMKAVVARANRSTLTVAATLPTYKCVKGGRQRPRIQLEVRL
ncbi:hypothetical protein SAMN05216281_105177 [Cryobacterium luteum]|nr:hypothetical protein SAMN05216281_105177 [Cryobacterium luteum]